MKFLALASYASMFFIVGCSSSGPINIGQNTYMLTKTSTGCGFASAASVKTDLYKEAGGFCQNTNKDLHVISSSGNDGIVMVRCASAEIQFSCLAKVEEGSLEYLERNRKQEQRITREAANKPSEVLVVSPPPLIVTTPAPTRAPVSNPVNCTSLKTGNMVTTNCY
jgi:hypothetical protein